jgi:hypothetical protein
MSGYYTVQQGDHLTRIAISLGFPDWSRVWNAPENADLRSKRTSPDVLMPGDSLYVPDLQTKELSAATDQGHKYVLVQKPLNLRIKILDRFNDCLSNTDCNFVIGGDSKKTSTDSGGRLEHPLTLQQRRAAEGSLQLQEPLVANQQNLVRTVQVPLQLGHIDPVDEVSGQLKRLQNLGYYPPLNGDDPDAKLFRAAVEEFQCENHLTVDGICGPQTQAKLKAVYGC